MIAKEQEIAATHVMSERTNKARDVSQSRGKQQHT